MTTATQLRGFELQNALVARSRNLPPISASVVELTSVCVKPDWSTEDACAIIDRDPLLLGALLREANSAVFASASLVGTSADALVRLGSARVMTVAVEMGLENLLGNTSVYGPAALDVFKHSHITSIAAEVVRERSRVRLPQVLAAASLVHDIGELVLAHFIEESSMLDLTQAQNSGMTLLEAERSVLDLDHAEVGAIICQQWRMPEAISDAIRHHHTPWVSDEPVVYAVSLADLIAETAAAYPIHARAADSLTVSRCMVELDMEHIAITDLARETMARVEKHAASV